ncbi:cytochrome c oxidase subunit II [Methylobrevis albus]|uniref:cytochrome c oxidase subunit II n=1 Tax=Methylobrevis albus TaxID=2793297 RepID=UPI0038B2759B
MTTTVERLKGLVAAAAAFAGSATAAAAAQPTPWQASLQPAATEVMADIVWFESFTFWIVTVITLFVLGLLVYICVRFNEKNNPVPSRTSHNTMIEIVWTIAPVLILLVIAIPSFRLLYKQLVIPEADMTVKVTGYQWYWGYEYPDNDGIAFDAYMVEEADITDPVRQPRLLATDYPVVVPVGKTVRLQVTAADVIHSFAMPAFGVKIDALPGRLNETWFRADAPGVYFGQCSELCGQRHAFMPIEIHAVTDEQFAQWATAAKDDIDAAKELLAELTREDTATDQLAQR